VRFDPFRFARALVRAGAALAAAVLLAACATPSAETYDPAQCVALGGSLVRQSADRQPGRQPGFRIEAQHCVFPGSGNQSP
jgi:hypothetical protein